MTVPHEDASDSRLGQGAFPGFSRIFSLSQAFARGALTVSHVSSGDPGPDLLRGALRPDSPVAYRREVGRRPMDLLAGSDAAVHLLSPATVDLLIANGLTGWDTYPVVIDPHGVNGDVAGFVGLSVIGRCGPIDKSHARVEMRISPIGRPIDAMVGLYFDPVSWDGSDIFTSTDDSTAFVLVTDRVRSAIVQAGLSNFTFEAASSFRWS